MSGLEYESIPAALTVDEVSDEHNLVDEVPGQALRTASIAMPIRSVVQLTAALAVLPYVVRNATPEEIRPFAANMQKVYAECGMHGPDAAERLYEAIMSDDFICGFDLAEETEDFNENPRPHASPDDIIASDGKRRPRRYGDRRCQNVVRASWDAEDGPRSSYPVFDGVEKECPGSHGWHDDSATYQNAAYRWMERLAIRRALMGRNPSWRLAQHPHPPSHDEPPLASDEP